jgi:hypothetical protein
VFRAFIDTIQAEVALGLMPWNSANRVVSSLAAQQTAITVVAVLRMLDEPEHTPPRQQTEKGAQRAECPAPKSSDSKIQNDQKNEDDAKPHTLPEKGLLEVEQDSSEDKVKYAPQSSDQSERALLESPQCRL